jgi:hypothetical protein
MPPATGVGWFLAVGVNPVVMQLASREFTKGGMLADGLSSVRYMGRGWLSGAG